MKSNESKDNLPDILSISGNYDENETTADWLGLNAHKNIKVEDESNLEKMQRDLYLDLLEELETELSEEEAEKHLCPSMTRIYLSCRHSKEAIPSHEEAIISDDSLLEDDDYFDDTNLDDYYHELENDLSLSAPADTAFSDDSFGFSLSPTEEYSELIEKRTEKFRFSELPEKPADSSTLNFPPTDLSDLFILYSEGRKRLIPTLGIDPYQIEDEILSFAKSVHSANIDRKIILKRLAAAKNNTAPQSCMIYDKQEAYSKEQQKNEKRITQHEDHDLP